MDKGRKEEQQAPTNRVALMPFRTEDCLSMVGSVVPLYCITLVGCLESCADFLSFRAMGSEGHHCAAVRLSAQPATVARSLASLGWACKKAGSVLIGPALAGVISRNNHNRRKAPLMHHGCSLLCIAGEIHRKAGLILPINHRKVVLSLPVMRVSEGNNLMVLKYSAHKVHHVPQNLASGGQVWEISRSVKP